RTTTTTEEEEKHTHTHTHTRTLLFITISKTKQIFDIATTLRTIWNKAKLQPLLLLLNTAIF
ncbi:MAG: hypothetical protein ACI8RD_005726, partial [Bacillariaceae sp.]